MDLICVKLPEDIIRFAASLLPEPSRGRYYEEWLADSRDCTNSLAKLRHAFECLACARGLADIQPLSDNEMIAATVGRNPRWALDCGQQRVTVDAATVSWFFKALANMNELQGDPAVASWFRAQISEIKKHFEVGEPNRDKIAEIERLIWAPHFSGTEGVKIRLITPSDSSEKT